MKKQIKENPSHKLMILIEDDKVKRFDEQGNALRVTKWVEVLDANLGSLRNPNQKILGVKWLPIKYERHIPDHPTIMDFFKDIRRFER
jgi:hypothetical protein